MSLTADFYEYIYRIALSSNEKVISVDPSNDSDNEEIRTVLLKHIQLFPHFPDINIISNLSHENYERKKCVADLVFLPFPKDVDTSLFSFTYANERILFDGKVQRLIRKISESLDKQHALVLGYDEDTNKYYIMGIVDGSKIDSLFKEYYYISIFGYLKWSVKCSNFNLFDYDAGKFFSFDYHSTEIKRQIDYATNGFTQEFSDIDAEKIKKILETIAEQDHGASFVLFESDALAQQETERLCNANRGFAAKEKLPYEKMLECLPQFTKVDGGLILDINLNCYAYGCIYDGSVDESEEKKGELDRGSRFNSTKLYLHNIKGQKCAGIVFSDDGGIDFISPYKDNK